MDELMNQINYNQVFVNTPIDSKEKDFISVGTYAERLDRAINSGAHMLGLIGSFGVGKSSVISLLKEKYTDCEEAPSIYKVSMWSVLQKSNLSNDKIGDNTTDNNANVELHKSLIYQMASAIDPNIGTYVSRRLNKSFSMISVHARETYEKIVLIVAFIAFAVCFLIYNNYDVMSKLVKDEYIWLLFLAAFCITMGAIALIGFLGIELIYTRDKRDSANNIEENEIFDLYRTVILKKRFFKCFNPKRIIVVIEDLDRTENTEQVKSFLKELKKYCLIGEGDKYKNDIIFVVNIGFESSLVESVIKKPDESKDSKQLETHKKSRLVESLYSKVFDFTLELPKINILDYEEILVSLLVDEQENKEELAKELKTCTWFQWLIRDTDKYENEKFGIRQLKDRLNIALNLRENLMQKVPYKGTVDFNKCVAFAFLITAYEKEFCEMDDDAFDKIISGCIKGESIREACEDILQNSFNDDYKDIIIQLFEAELIKDDYRIYFYNYPIGCKFYSLNETIIMNAVLYGKGTENELSEAFENIDDSISMVVDESLSKIDSLGIVPNDLIFSSPQLLTVALSNYFTLIEKKIRGLKYDEPNKSKNLDLYITIIKLGFEVGVFGQKQIAKICDVLNEKCNEEILLDFRKNICANFSENIILFKSLFYETHSVISKEELGLISMEDGLNLMNVESSVFVAKNIDDLVDVFSEELQNVEIYTYVDEFILDCRDKISADDYVKTILDYMLISRHINSEMEEYFVSYIKNWAIAQGKDLNKDILFEKYQNAINEYARNHQLSENTKNNILKMNIERYSIFSDDVAKKLFDKKAYIQYALIMIANNEDVDFSNRNVSNAIKEYKERLLDNKKWFLLIRRGVENTNSELLEQYTFLFDDDCPALMAEEIEQILVASRYHFGLLFKLLNPSQVDEKLLNVIIKNVNSKHFKKVYTSSLFLFISKLSSALKEYAFDKIDFTQVKFSALSKQDKETVHKAVENIFSLNTVMGRINFMKTTRHLFFDWQDNILMSEINADKEKAKLYVEAVNASVDSKISPVVIRMIGDLNGYYELSPVMQNALMENGYFEKYIAGKALYDEELTIESGKLGDRLWPNYVNVYKKAELELKSIMGSSVDFSRRYLGSETLTIDVIKEKSNCYYPLCQTKEIVTMIFEDGNQEFIKEYFSKIGGFCDEAAATCFIDMLKMSAVAKNQSIYNNVYGKLTNVALEEAYDKIMGKSSTVAAN